MEVAGLKKFNVVGKQNMTAPYWGAAPRVYGGDRHNSTGKEQFIGNIAGRESEEEEEVLKRLFTKKAALALIQHLHEDYETFRFPEPAWVSHATGEWYEKIPDALACRVE